MTNKTNTRENAPTPTEPDTPAAQITMEEIAQRILNIATLETRKMDSLDFHEVAVWSLAEALRAAYESGFHDATSGHAKK